MANWNVSTLSAQKVDSSLCKTPFDPNECQECLDWSQIPKVISIDGAQIHKSTSYDEMNDVTQSRTVDLNGYYLRIEKQECDHGMPYFVKDYLQIVYDIQEDRWFASYYGAGNDDHIDFAKCVSNQTVFAYQDLFDCTEGHWHYRYFPSLFPSFSIFSFFDGLSISTHCLNAK